jgi:hypothetical protein
MVDISRKQKNAETQSTAGPFMMEETVESKEIDAWGRELDQS